MKNYLNKIVLVVVLLISAAQNNGYSHAWSHYNSSGFSWINSYECNASTQVHPFTQTVNEWWWWFGWHHRRYQVPVWTSPCSQSEWEASALNMPTIQAPGMLPKLD